MLKVLMKFNFCPQTFFSKVFFQDIKIEIKISR